MPYQLVAEFAWDWLDVHYWTSRFIIVNAMLLSVLELFSFWKLWSRRELKTIPHRMWKHFWKVSTQGLFVAVFWPFIPQFVCNCLFYWALYFNPIINIDLVVKEIRRLETQVQWLNELLSWLVSKNACLKETLCFVLFCFSFIMWQWK